MERFRSEIDQALAETGRNIVSQPVHLLEIAFVGVAKSRARRRGGNLEEPPEAVNFSEEVDDLHFAEAQFETSP